VLHLGDNGPAVTRLQTGLTQLGFDAGHADGVFGRETEAALRAFQREIGVDVDGVYGRQTEAALSQRLERHRDDGPRGREPPDVEVKAARMPLKTAMQRAPEQPDAARAPERPPGPPPEPSQNARLVADNPATEDLLDREGFANALAVLIDLQRAETRDPISGPILVHLYGSWGSGKTTLFGLLRRSLESPSEGLEPRRKHWLCVTFNAWGHQRTAPPWWWLMDGVYREATARRRRGQLDPLSMWRRLRIWVWWWGLALVALLAASALLVCSVIFGIVTIDRMAGAKDAVNIVVGLFIAAGSAVALVRSTKSSLLVGSPRAATALLRSGGDPYRRIRNRYAKLVEKTGRNVLVFIDDLDRCQPDYVVELLEGIQTIFNDTSVTYLVAADREWVSESFQRVYTELGAAMDRPGRPLGYLFLEKTFAVSAPLPRPSPAAQARYWQAVLTGDALGSMETITGDDRRAANAAMAQDTPEEAAARAAELPDGDLSGEARALREKAAIKLAEAAAAGEQDHVLAPYLPLLDTNPRALKRLRNAYAIATMGRFASLDIATSDHSVDALVRWTILTLRWPWLADRVIEQPGTLHAILHPGEVPLDGDLAEVANDGDLLHLLRDPVADGVTPDLETWLAAELGERAPADDSADHADANATDGGRPPPDHRST
jgi:peptidoglycan hydrolase-like protein with peptidoglycan-binding domain